jgi:hypothetical protein
MSRLGSVLVHAYLQPCKRNRYHAPPLNCIPGDVSFLCTRVPVLPCLCLTDALAAADEPIWACGCPAPNCDVRRQPLTRAKHPSSTGSCAVQRRSASFSCLVHPESWPGVQCMRRYKQLHLHFCPTRPRFRVPQLQGLSRGSSFTSAQRRLFSRAHIYARLDALRPQSPINAMASESQQEKAQHDGAQEHAANLDATHREAFGYWGYLLQEDKCGTPRLNHLLMGIAEVIVSRGDRQGACDIRPQC